MQSKTHEESDSGEGSTIDFGSETLLKLVVQCIHVDRLADHEFRVDFRPKLGVCR